MIVQEISKNIDGYRLSTYMHKQAEGDDGGKLFMGPTWDVNLGFDNADSHGNGLGHDPTGWLFAGSPQAATAAAQQGATHSGGQRSSPTRTSRRG